jgi:hypothetical protein
MPQGNTGYSCSTQFEQNATFTYNDTLYNARFYLSDGAVTIVLNQNMIREFRFQDQIYMAEQVGATGNLVIEVPLFFLEQVETDNPETVFYSGPILPNGTIGPRAPEFSFLNLNSGNVRLRVDLYPVDLEGEIFGAKDENKYLWAYTFLFFVSKIFDNAKGIQNKRYMMTLRESVIEDLKTSRMDGVIASVAALVKDEMPYDSASSTGVLSDQIIKTTLDTYQRDVIKYNYKFYEDKDGTDLIGPGVFYTQFTDWATMRPWDLIIKSFNGHSTELKYPVLNFLKLEKPNKEYRDDNFETNFRKFSIKTLRDFFDPTKIFKTAKNTGQYMLETFYIRGEAGSCKWETDGKDTNKNTLKQKYGIVDNLVPGLHNIISNFEYSRGVAGLDKLLKAFTFHFRGDFYTELFSDTLSNKDYKSLIDNIIKECFGNSNSTSFSVNTEENANIENRDVDCGVYFFNDPASPEQFVTVANNEAFVLEDMQPLDLETAVVGLQNTPTGRAFTLDVLLTLGRKLQENFIYGVDTIEFVVDGLTLREPGRFFKLDRVTDENDSGINNNLLGYWFVISVESVFSEKKFYQKLLAVKIYNTNYVGDINTDTPKTIEDVINNPSVMMMG